MKIKQGLYLLHRWLGIVMCLFIAMWFFSGVVMMYVGFPQLTTTERLSALPPLSAKQVAIHPNTVIAQIESVHSISSLKLSSLQGRPIYRIKTHSGKFYSFYADSGEALGAITIDRATAIAIDFQAESSAIKNRELVDIDQWTVSSSLRIHRPFYKISFNDSKATDLYISSLTGEVIRDTNRKERIWNWLGANLHWIYPRVIRQHPTIWHWLVIALSVMGLIAILSGGIIGYIRLRIRKKYRGKDSSPYRGWMKWHHILGLSSLIFLSTFMFSGLMSMNPFGVFNSKQSFSELRRDYSGDIINAGNDADFEYLKAAINKQQAREVKWQWVNGEASQILVSSATKYSPIYTDQQNPDEQLGKAKEQLEYLMKQADEPAELIEETLIHQYDLYYYSHHDRWRPLPALRLKFNNNDESWFYLDASTGELLSHQTKQRRVQRWLYNGLHSLDFQFLIQHRPAWDIVLILLCFFGLTMAVSSIVIAWRRLEFNKRRRAKQRTSNEPRPNNENLSPL